MTRVRVTNYPKPDVGISGAEGVVVPFAGEHEEIISTAMYVVQVDLGPQHEGPILGRLWLLMPDEYEVIEP